MKLTPVDSSNIKAIGYEGGELVVQFHRNLTLYRYRNVTPELHTKFLESRSKGQFFDATLRRDPKTYPCERLTPAETAALLGPGPSSPGRLPGR